MYLMVSNMNFDKEKFLAGCCSCGCDRSGREAILAGIEYLKDSNPELSQQLIYYRDHLFDADLRRDKFYALRKDMGEKELNHFAAKTLRAMADKLEENGSHFMIDCQLPKLPIFDEYSSSIEVHLVRGPLGG